MKYRSISLLFEKLSPHRRRMALVAHGAGKLFRLEAWRDIAKWRSISLARFNIPEVARWRQARNITWREKLLAWHMYVISSIVASARRRGGVKV